LFTIYHRKTFDRRNNTYIGLGWGIIEDRDFTVLAHDGSTGGFTSILMLDKTLK
jgi:hypothetical protein